MDDLAEKLDEIEQEARDGLSQIGYSEVVACHRCQEARWIRQGVHKIGCALWRLKQIVRGMKSESA